MKPLYLLALGATLLIFSGCSEEAKEPENGKPDHFLRQPMDTMYDAKAVQKTMNETTQEQEKQAKQIMGR